MVIIYASYGSMRQEKCDSIEEGKQSLYDLEEDGGGYGLGIWDEENKTFYMEENLEVIGKTKAIVCQQKIDSLKELGIEPLKTETFPPYFGGDSE